MLEAGKCLVISSEAASQLSVGSQREAEEGASLAEPWLCQQAHTHDLI